MVDRVPSAHAARQQAGIRAEAKKEAKAKKQAKAKAKATTKAAPKPTTKPAEQYHTSPCTMRQRVSDIICKDSFEINFGDILCHA